MYIEADRVFMIRSFIFHTYPTNIFMKKSFFLVKLLEGFITRFFLLPPNYTNMLTNKTTEKHKDVPPGMGGRVLHSG